MYYSVEWNYLFPAKNKMEKIKCECDDLDLVGDAKFNSPGCNTKYGTRTFVYLFMHSQSNETIDFL